MDTLSRPTLPATPWSSGRFTQLLLDHNEYYFGRYQALPLLTEVPQNKENYQSPLPSPQPAPNPNPSLKSTRQIAVLPSVLFFFPTQ